VTARADLLSRADRRRLLERLADLRELDALMREPGTLARPSAARTTPPTRKDPHDRDTRRNR